MPCSVGFAVATQKEHGRLLFHIKEEIPVKGRPGSIPDQIEIDVLSLEIGDKLVLEALNLPKTVEITEEDADVIAICSPSNKAAETSEESDKEEFVRSEVS